MWRLYYHDRTTFSSTDGEWVDAPVWGVMGLAVLDDDVGYYRNTNDLYILPPWATLPFGCDHYGALDYLLQVGALAPDEPLTSKPIEFFEMMGVKVGRNIDNDEWQEVLAWMANDPDLPHKSARRVNERP